MEFVGILLALIVRNIIANDVEDKVDYSKVVRWERRTLVCRTRNANNSTHLPADCRLKIGKDGTEVSTACFVETFEQRSLGGRKSIAFSNKRTLCDIQCKGADRDSVISKIPNSLHDCIRWYNYNTLKRDGRWFMWRSDKCRNLDVTLEVHCGFPYDESGSTSLTPTFRISTKLNHLMKIY
uniref:FHA domain-containing protein n=1 Tax=Parascaris univalens TaxID=6257 RepID=A0A915B4X5_PARUN